MSICLEVEKSVVGRLPDILSLRNTARLKGDGTFVSDGDLLCQRIVEATLNMHLPDAKIISEERENDCSDLSRYEYIITIDPIDGTENFVSGLREWGIGVSVYRNMRHAESMILLPELNISLHSGDIIERFRGSRICGLSSYMMPKDFENLGEKHEYRIMGCCMYNMYNVIKGSYSKFVHLKGCYSWDILPGMNLALEHGLNVQIDGKPYNGEFLYPGVKYKFSVY